MHHAHRCFFVPVSTGTPSGKATRPSLGWNGVRPKPQRQDNSHRRGRDRGAGGGPTPLEGGPDGAREVSLPGSARRSRGRRRGSTRRPGVGGSQFMTTIVFVKYGAHHPLNRQRDRYAGEGVDLSLSTLADQVGTCAVALRGRCTTRSPPTCWRRSTCTATARRCRFSPKARRTRAGPGSMSATTRPSSALFRYLTGHRGPFHVHQIGGGQQGPQTSIRRACEQQAHRFHLVA